MLNIGYWLSCEMHSPSELVHNAKQAEASGFEFALISDHYHPWLDVQGHSPFMWSVAGAIAQATQRLRLGPAVVCPLIRTHPAIIAQAAATTAALMPGRFFLGLGTGEYLNEHIVGAKWPSAGVRLEMLEEAIEIIRSLWTGKMTNHRGRHYTVENARIYDLPESPTPIMIAAGGKRSTGLAGCKGDGVITSSLTPEVIDRFHNNGGKGKPRYGRLEVCWGKDEAAAQETAHRWWRSSGVKGQAKTELAIPAYFEQLSGLVTEEEIASEVICGPDPDRHIEKFKKFAEAGYTHVAVHQVSPDQEGFFRFYEREVMSRLSDMGLAAAPNKVVAD